MDLVDQLFGLVCGSDRRWAPDGFFLPFCQRCTGLYVGTTVAVVLHLFFRLRYTPKLLLAHGLMLALMVPLGFHWIPHGPALRTVSGQLYAAGLVCYLLVLPFARWSPWWDRAETRSWRPYALALTASLVLLPLLAWDGGTPAAWVLRFLGLAGLMLLTVLAVVNLGLLVLKFLNSVYPSPKRET